MPVGVYKRTQKHRDICKKARAVSSGSTGKTWKIKDTSKMKGRVPKTAFKKGYKSWNTGLKDWLSEEHKKAIINANTKYTEEEKLKMVRYGFKKYKQKVLIRDNYLCQTCFKTSKYLQVDHIKPWAEFPELRYDIDNCRTLCMPCHYYITYKRELPEGKLWGHNIRRII